MDRLETLDEHGIGLGQIAEETSTTTDCIDRQQAIEALTGWQTEPLDEDIVRTLNNLPPVTPTVSEDCISREWLKGQIEEVEYENAWHMKETDEFVSWENINNAPSVTPTDQTIKEIMDFIGGMNMVGEISNEAYTKISAFVDDGTPTEGEWVFRTDIPIGGGAESAGYVCSECKAAMFKTSDECPNCGAKMKGAV